jgi:putative ABC transport system substrate-binding protein
LHLKCDKSNSALVLYGTPLFVNRRLSNSNFVDGIILMINRRNFVGVIAGGLAVTQSRAEAQPAAKVRRIGFLLGASGPSVASLFHALRDGLHDLGHIEGRDIVFVERYGGGRMEQLPVLAAELVRLNVDLIVTGTNFHVAAVQRATKTIPVVMVFVADPVGSGFIASLARPGGNITGLSADAGPELWAKYLAMLREVVPKLSRVGVLGQVASKVGFSELQRNAQNQNIELEVADLQRVEDFDAAFKTLIDKRIDALFLVVGPLTYLLRKEIADAALKHRLPSMTNATQFSEAGLLMSYGPNLDDLYRRAAIYVDKILRGAVPADIPVEQPTKFDLVINLKTAKAIEIDVPLQLQQLANDVIE